jgi:hypothetical protein
LVLSLGADDAAAAWRGGQVAPGMIAVLSPLLIGVFAGPECLAGLLTGAIVVGSMFAIMMANAGGAWDNCKKYIESGPYGGKGSVRANPAPDRVQVCELCFSGRNAASRLRSDAVKLILMPVTIFFATTIALP